MRKANLKDSDVAALGCPSQFPLIALDLADTKAALELAQRLAEQTGRIVTVRDAAGEIVGTFR